MKLWILDADVIIDFLGLGIFDKLADLHSIYAASTVIDEVRYFKRGGTTITVDFRSQYILSGLVNEMSASIDEISNILSLIPPLKHNALDDGELESLAILMREKNLTFCTRDAAAIRAMPFLDATERGISVESLLKKSGLRVKDLKDHHSDEYLRENLLIGQKDKIYDWTP